MPAPTTDLWPDFQAPEAINSPVFLLKEQAAALQKKTRGLVLAGLRPAAAPDGSFWVGFDLYSPALGEYSYRLFEVTYPPEFFPITLTANGSKTAQTLEQFKAILQLVIQQEIPVNGAGARVVVESEVSQGQLRLQKALVNWIFATVFSLALLLRAPSPFSFLPLFLLILLGTPRLATSYEEFSARTAGLVCSGSGCSFGRSWPNAMAS